MSDLTETQEEGLRRIRAAKGHPVPLPTSTGSSLVDKGFAAHVSSDDESVSGIALDQGHAFYRAR